jgi:hypothetical protein
MVCMKATIDIPDELYRQVKAKSALRGQAVREVAVSLFQGWISQLEETAVQTPSISEGQPVPSWFGGARRYGQRVQRHDMTAVRRSIVRGRTDAGDDLAAAGEQGA